MKHSVLRSKGLEAVKWHVNTTIHNQYSNQARYMAVIPQDVPTFGGPGSPQVVDGPQYEPQGLLLVAGDAQHLHRRLQFGELLGRSLLILGLQGMMPLLVRCCGTHFLAAFPLK